MRTSTALYSLATATLLAVTATGQTWQVAPLVTGLATPTGIVTDNAGTLYFSEVPTPGVSGAMNGQNRIAALDLATNTITTVNFGEPDPRNLAMGSNGDLYWTCRSAGVILRRSGAVTAPFITNLPSPTGIAYTPAGDLAVTFVPTPGIGGNMNGTNSIGVFVQTTLTTLNTGEPEPVDIAATPNGDLYWTCRTAGVILRRDAASTMIAPVLRGLERPTGIAADGLGNLYFTEVPTPGVSGAMGGRNRVWKYEPATDDLTLVSMGEPEPTDITASANGDTLYWTCTSANVIVRAVRTGDAPRVTATPAMPGNTLRNFLHAPAAPGTMYLAATSARIGSVLLPDGRGVGLAMDSLFYGTFLNAGAPAATGYFGLLDSNGMGTTQLVIPANPMLQGLSLYTAFVTLDATASMGIGAISATHRETVL